MFYCDAKYSDIPVHSRCYLFLGCGGKKWVQPFISWNSKICFLYLKNELIKLSYFAHADTNLGKLNVNNY